MCDNIFGLSCIDLKQFEQAEIRLDSALNILQKYSEETLSLRVRHNLAWLYASQNLSELAMRHISEVTTKQQITLKHFLLKHVNTTSLENIPRLKNL